MLCIELGIDSKILKFFTLPLPFQLKQFFVLTQSSENCPGESVNMDGIFRVTDVVFSKSAILKPLSAFTESPYSNKSSSPHQDVNSLSDMLP